jgi:hypothetical protein
MKPERLILTLYQLIKDDLGDEFPDVDLIDIRDALTGYGKQINQNGDEITAQVNKLKNTDVCCL